MNVGSTWFAVAAVAALAAACSHSEPSDPGASASAEAVGEAGAAPARDPLAAAKRELTVLRRTPFARLDRNGDGVLADTELPIALGSSFVRADLDGSGGLNPAELRAEFDRLEARLARGPALDPAQPAASWSALKADLDKVVEHHALDGAALLIGRGEAILFEGYSGGYGPDTLINMASASKWPGGAAVAAAVAEGKLDAEAPLRTWRTELAGDPKGDLTLLQLMSFTHGGASVIEGTPDIALDPRMPLADAAGELLKQPLVSAPGTEFSYGGWGQQVGAAWAAAATGEYFGQLWRRAVADPAGMANSHFGHPRASLDAKDLSNPNLQAGLWTTPRDFARFMMMMHAGGRLGGSQVYPSAAIRLIERDYARGLPHRWRGGGAEGGLSYGFALWCEKTAPDGSCPVVSSGGAWGTMPWIDREKDVWGLFYVYDRGPRLRPDLNVLRAAAETIATAGG